MERRQKPVSPCAGGDDDRVGAMARSADKGGRLVGLNLQDLGIGVQDHPHGRELHHEVRQDADGEEHAGPVRLNDADQAFGPDHRKTAQSLVDRDVSEAQPVGLERALARRIPRRLIAREIDGAARIVVPHAETPPQSLPGRESMGHEPRIALHVAIGVAQDAVLVV